MTILCPNKKCNVVSTHLVIYENDGRDNIDGLGHSHMKCSICGYNWNRWHSYDKMKAVFGKDHEIYK